uniref:Uncharacterized protein n=1 Tax=Arundo donax TaxID=35708 RepID=A0A0A9DBP8_ARUDO
MSSPIAGEISPPRFRFDRFLYFHRKQSHHKILLFHQTDKNIMLRQKKKSEQNLRSKKSMLQGVKPFTVICS